MNKGNERLANLVDEGLELTDPHPDIHELFRLYDHQFFSGTLSSRACTVEWSKRMTSCAGICQFRKGFCCIRLSEPLLTLRRRKDLVETLLHEMIHGYLFLTGGFRFMDRDGHGPEFQFHMHRINSLASTSITIYHSFHAEVSHYKQHWWRCTGPCQERAPYFGWVKRATNRAPGPYDIWWKGHEMNCNGSFVKVKEPEKKAKVTKSKTSASDGPSTSNSNNNQQKMSKRKKPIKAQIDPKQPKIDQLFPGKGHVLGGFKNIAVAADAEHKGEDDDDITIIAQVINNRPQLDQIDNKPLPFLDKGYRLGY